MDYYVWAWLIVTVILVVLELVTSGFGVICFAIGSLLSVVVALCGPNFYWQVAAFALGSLLAFIFIRPVVLKYLTKKSEETLTNVDALIGRTAIVSETINPEEHTGRVKIDGDDWKAIASQRIEIGTEVKVTEQNSLVLTVTPL